MRKRLAITLSGLLQCATFAIWRRTALKIRAWLALDTKSLTIAHKRSLLNLSNLLHNSETASVMPDFSADKTVTVAR